MFGHIVRDKLIRRIEHGFKISDSGEVIFNIPVIIKNGLCSFCRQEIKESTIKKATQFLLNKVNEHSYKYLP